MFALELITLEALGVLIAVAAIGTFARGKNLSPELAGGSAVSGYLLIRIAGILLTGNEQGLYFIVGAWTWLAVIAGYLRFVVGAGRVKPDMQWNCSNCHYLNSASSI